ncbi:MAG TPA: SAM-dependent methyltransferase, partial [Pusillimonas sp.]|nr:SAM-dependent methyltransferase [Pusillimonas sp.]
MAIDSLLHLARMLKSTGYVFTTVTPATHARVNSRADNVWARSTEDVFGWSRPFREGVLTPELFQAMRDADVLDTHG